MPLVHEERSGYAIAIDRHRVVGPERLFPGVHQDRRPVPAGPLDADPHEAVADRELLGDGPVADLEHRGGGRRASRALTFQQTSRWLPHADRAGRHLHGVGGLAGSRPARATPASPPSLSVITASSPTRKRPGLVPEASWPRSRVTGKAMTSIGTTARTNSRPAASEDPPLGPQRHPGAVLEQLQRQEVGVDVVADALDRALVRGVLEDGEQQHARHRRDGRGGEPPRHDADGGEQEPSQEARRRR